MSDLEAQLDIITGLVSAMLRDYRRSPGIHSLAPHIGIIRLWYETEAKRRQSTHEKQKEPDVHDSHPILGDDA